MKKSIVFSLVLAVAIGLALSGILYAHTPGSYTDEDVKTEIKKIDKGIQLTVTSDDPEKAKDIQQHTKWYERFFTLREQCQGMMGMMGMMGNHTGGMMGSRSGGMMGNHGGM